MQSPLSPIRGLYLRVSPLHRDRMTALREYAAASGLPVPTVPDLAHTAMSAGIAGLENGSVPLPSSAPDSVAVRDRARRAAAGRVGSVVEPSPVDPSSSLRR